MHATDEIDQIDDHDDDHAPAWFEGWFEGWFEACVEHRGPVADGPCEHCGWLASDHTAGLAVVIEVGRVTAAPLRRAS
ncbi:MAG: hypothetical protein WDA60_07310 [Acidimicrobiia bacterium]|jgi:hypothetical protein